MLHRFVVRGIGWIALLSVTSLLPRVAIAEVEAAGPSGFRVVHEYELDAPPARVYAAFLDVGKWWAPEHTYSGDSANLDLEGRRGGWFAERLKDRGIVRHMAVVFVAPRKQVRLLGGLGPLQEHAVQGSMTVRFDEAGEGTTIEVVYNVGGWVPGGLESWAAPVDAVVGEQFARLESFVETGDPTGSRE